GYSTRVQLSSVCDYAPELTATADALGIDSFSIVGYSGGAPYALAAAHAAPRRVELVAVVAGAGHVGEWASIADFSPSDRRMTWLAEHHRAELRAGPGGGHLAINPHVGDVLSGLARSPM